MRLSQFSIVFACLGLSGCAAYQEHMATRWTPGSRMFGPDAAQMRPPADPFVSHKSADWTRYFPHLSKFAQTTSTQMSAVGASVKERFSPPAHMHAHPGDSKEAPTGEGRPSELSNHLSEDESPARPPRRGTPVLPIAIVAEVAPAEPEDEPLAQTAAVESIGGGTEPGQIEPNARDLMVRDDSTRRTLAEVPPTAAADSTASETDPFEALRAFGDPVGGRNLVTADEPGPAISEPPGAVAQIEKPEQKTLVQEPTIESIPEPRLQDLPEDDPFAAIASLVDARPEPARPAPGVARLEAPKGTRNLRSFRRVPNPLQNGPSGDLSGRPRSDLVRPWVDTVSAELPLAEYPVSYYGPDGVPPPERPAMAGTDRPKQRRLSLPNLGLAQRWNAWRQKRVQARSGGAAEPGDGAQGR